MERDFDPEYERVANERAKAWTENYEKERAERQAQQWEYVRDAVKEGRAEARREQERQAKAERERQRRRKKNKKKKPAVVFVLDKVEETVADVCRILFK